MERDGAPGVIRTPDLLVRSQLLYPAELRAHIALLQPFQDTEFRAEEQPSRVRPAEENEDSSAFF